MRQWISDLALGVRLALGGSRRSWVRLALQGLGIGMCVAVLLFAASLPTAFEARDTKADASEPVSGVTDSPSLLVQNTHPTFRGDTLRGRYVRVLGADAPRPLGVEKLPDDGEIVVSPALAELLASPEGELLRPRFPQKVIGTIGEEGLRSPLDLLFFAGDGTIEPSEGNMTIAFGVDYGGGELPPVLWLLSLVGVIVLLFPVLVFVGVAARLAAAQRDRRLAALRLVGAGAKRVRLIASGEALIGAVAGLVTGFGLFYLFRPLSDDIRIAQLAVYPSDLTPSLGLTLVVVIAVPVLAVGTSLFAMRQTIIEPLGVVRQQHPVRRRLWWRLLPAAAGVALLASQFDRLTETDRPVGVPIVLGVVLLLFGIPALLPWLVERVVFRLRGGSPAMQLAVRRLQLDSGTAARVVGGVAVVLAGTVTLQMVLAGVQNQVAARDQPVSRNELTVNLNTKAGAPGLAEALGKAPGVLAVHEFAELQGRVTGNEYVNVTVASCEALAVKLDIANCADGKGYVVPRKGTEPGTVLAIGMEARNWTVPAGLETTTAKRGGIYLTPAAATGLDQPAASHREYLARLDQKVPDAVEHARNALGPFGWRVSSFYNSRDIVPETERLFRLVRQALLAGSIITLLLAGASMLVVALEQVRERRRPFAVLAASGVPRGTLARSLLWQNGVPLVLATAVSVATGIGLGALSMRVAGGEVAYDWAGVATITGASVVLVLVVTALTLPSLRRATGALGLRTE